MRDDHHPIHPDPDAPIDEAAKRDLLHLCLRTANRCASAREPIAEIANDHQAAFEDEFGIFLSTSDDGEAPMSLPRMILMPGRAFADDRLNLLDLQLLARIAVNENNGWWRPNEDDRKELERRLSDLERWGYLARNERYSGPEWRIIFDVPGGEQ